MKNLYSYILLMRLDKPVGIFLLLWPTLIALWIAGQGRPDPYIVVIFVLGVIIMRSAGCVINDWTDRDFDKKVSRTKDRPLATGELPAKYALILFGVLILIALFLVLHLNFLSLQLSICALLLAVSYPWMKRYTHFPQMVLGMAFACAVPMAFAALNQRFSISTLLLYLATVVWVIVYDTEYAMVDRADDIRIGVKSTAIFFGSADRGVIGVSQCGFLFLLLILGLQQGFGKIYYTGLLGSAGLMLYQQYLIKDRLPDLCFKAFLNNPIVGFILFSAVFLEYY